MSINFNATKINERDLLFMIANNCLFAQCISNAIIISIGTDILLNLIQIISKQSESAQ